MNRRSFFQKLFGATVSTTLLDKILPAQQIVDVVKKTPLIFKSIEEFLVYMVQLEIDYDIIRRIIQIHSPETEIPKFKDPVHGEDYIFEYELV